ncbi:MAG TPA: hypothetical protein VHF70_06880 [Rubrobacteraceae bacterium]|nr:hypothetical protein [Rubrobacteraceae bacterium]
MSPYDTSGDAESEIDILAGFLGVRFVREEKLVSIEHSGPMS